ncbi:hypothetical protein H6G81_23375 [Scytonema hofmannii FACHB-248]|uniref:Uncharacterized protein n=1 Tax=Scytonema hofmannii FACHB-248 TaxID=1842502 RepID=A0ABR8GWE8_9CYAN|nr:MULTISPECIES: hypothetical protein [Nostocales]MBD2607385.1 hypothetical protein [Scytonema hofmannii FACHB-248]
MAKFLGYYCGNFPNEDGLLQEMVEAWGGTFFQTDPFHFSNKDGLNAVSLGYQVPLNPKNGTLQLRLERRREKIVQDPFDKFDFRAESELLETQ